MDNTVFMFSDKTYARLKWFVMIFLPAVSALYVGLAELWGLPGALAVSGSLALVAAFLGTLLGISSKTYHQQPKPADGVIRYEQLEQGIDLNFSTNEEMQELIKRDEVTFKIEPKHG